MSRPGFRGRRVAIEPYAGWLKTHESVVFFHEMAGRWQVRQQAVLDLHARHRDTSSADDIAWFAATHGLPGECEGFVPCHLSRMNSLDGTYLRLHPAGRHVDESVTRISTGLHVAPGRDRRVLRSAQGLRGADVVRSTPLDAAVSATRAGARTDALSALGRVRAPCK